MQLQNLAEKAYQGNKDIIGKTTPRTSITHPINISWLFPPDLIKLARPYTIDLLTLLPQPNKPIQLTFTSTTDHTAREEFEKEEAGIPPGVSNTSVVDEYTDSKPSGNFALSSCPGKKVRLNGPVNGRAMISRDLNSDFARMANFGIRTVICCLNDAELIYLGARFSDYLKFAEINGMDVIRIPMIEGSCPDTIEEIEPIIDQIVTKTSVGGENVLCHCRGGIGRAGLVACCYLIKIGAVTSFENAIRFVRIRRSPKAIETKKQEDYIEEYWNKHHKSAHT